MPLHCQISQTFGTQQQVTRTHQIRLNIYWRENLPVAEFKKELPTKAERKDTVKPSHQSKRMVATITRWNSRWASVLILSMGRRWLKKNKEFAILVYSLVKELSKVDRNSTNQVVRKSNHSVDFKIVVLMKKPTKSESVPRRLTSLLCFLTLTFLPPIPAEVYFCRTKLRWMHPHWQKISVSRYLQQLQTSLQQHKSQEIQMKKFTKIP